MIEDYEFSPYPEWKRFPQLFSDPRACRMAVHHDQGLLPARPEPLGKNPEELIDHNHSWPRMLALEYRQLLPQN